MTIKSRKLTKNYFYNLSYQIFCMLVPLITTPYISRVLGPANIGIYSYTLAVSLYFMIIGNLGTPLYGQRETAYYLNDLPTRTQVFFEVSAARTVTLLLTIFAYLIFCVFIASENKIIYLLQVIGIIANVFDVSWFFQGLEDFKITITRSFIMKIFSVVCLFLFVKKPNDLPIYTIIIGAANLLANTFLFLSSRKYLCFTGKIKIKFNALISHIKHSVILGIPFYMTAIYAVLDKTMLGFMTGDYADVGYYEQSQKIILFSFAIVASIGTVFLPRLANEFKENNTQELRHSIDLGINLVIILAMPMTVCAALLGRMIVPWFFGAGYEKAGELIVVFSPLIIIMGIGNLIGSQYLVAVKKEKELSVTVAIGLLCNVVINLLLIPKYASVGAAIGTVASELIKTILQIFIVKTDISINAFIRNVAKYGLFSAIMGSGIYTLNVCIFCDKTIFNTFVLIAAGGAMYGVCLLAEIYVSRKTQQ